MYYANGSILIQYWNQGEKIDNKTNNIVRD